MKTTSKARLLLPRPPNLSAEKVWEPLRRELRHYNLHMTILGLTPEGRPHIKLVGTRRALRQWLDSAGYDCVSLED